MHRAPLAFLPLLIAASLSSIPRTVAAQGARPECDMAVKFLAEFPQLTVSARDTIATDWLAGRRVPGCRVRLTRPNGGDAFIKNPVDVLGNRFRAAGWREDGDYGADGPDGTDVGMRKGSVVCVIEASWNGGDDSDSTYVSDNRYEVTISCFTKHTT